jgi:type II secretory pathway component PulF
METTDIRPRAMRTATCAVLCHTAAPLVWFVFFVFVVPRFAALLSDISDGSMRLPLLTQWVLNLSAFIGASWYIYFFVLTPLIAMDVAICSRLIVSRGRPSAGAWSMFVLACEAVFTLFLVIGICLPVTYIG